MLLRAIIQQIPQDRTANVALERDQLLVVADDYDTAHWSAHVPRRLAVDGAASGLSA